MFAWLSRNTSRRSSRARRFTTLRFESLEDRSVLAADIVGYYCDVSESSANPGQSVQVSWGVWNAGDLPTFSGFYVTFYATNPGGTWQQLDSVWVNSLNVFGTYSTTSTVTLPSSGNAIFNTAGNYKIQMLVDSFGHVFESNESNNWNYGWGYDFDYVYINPFKPDLAAQNIAVYGDGSPIKPGSAVSVYADVVNLSASAAGTFYVGVYLSSDNVITSDDRYLTSIYVPSLSGFSTAFIGSYLNATLPEEGDSFWNDGDEFHIGLIVDMYNWNDELNEANNRNRGLGVDLASVDVELTINLSQLAPTGFSRTGVLAKEYLYQTRISLEKLADKYDDLYRSAGNDAQIRTIRDWVGDLADTIRRLENAIGNIGSGRQRSVQLGNGVVLDMAQIELFERFIIRLIRDVGDVASSSYSTFSAVPIVFAAAGTGDAGLDSVLAQVKEMISSKNSYGAAEKYERDGAMAAAGSGNAPAAGMLSYMSAVTNTIGKMLDLGQEGIYGDDKQKLEGATAAIKKEKLGQMLDAKIAELRNVLTGKLKPIGELRKWLGILERYKGLFPSLDKMVQQFSDYYNAARRTLFNGTWKGVFDSVVTLNGTNFYNSDAMKIQFSSDRVLGQLSGYVKNVFRVLNEAGQTVRKYTMSSKFFGRWTTNNKFEGTIDLKTPTGIQEQRPFSWTYDGDKLQGAWYQGSASTITVRK